MVGTTVRTAVEQACEVFEHLPRDKARMLFVAAEGNLANDVDAIVAGRGGMNAIKALQAGLGQWLPTATGVSFGEPSTYSSGRVRVWRTGLS